ncbi:sensor histidine kinase [Leucobacter albus]|uniref:sensor histidine kinase n=1 Tax=Leucobacter albus TaxID=272210 RepID=UPI0031DE6FA3
MNSAREAGASNAWARYGWLMGAIWLVFLYYPAVALLQSAAPAAIVALGWLGLALFGAAYLVGFIVGMRTAHGNEGGPTLALYLTSIACALLTVPAIGWGATSFAPFIMAYASYLLSRPIHWVANTLGPALVAVQCITAEARGASPAWPLLGIVLMAATVNTINSWLVRRSAAADGLRLELATSEGREAVARDVHDLLGHSLTVVKLKAELAAKLIDDDPAAARAELDEIVRLTSEALAGVRGTVTGVRAERLADGLAEGPRDPGGAGLGVGTVDGLGVGTVDGLGVGTVDGLGVGTVDGLSRQLAASANAFASAGIALAVRGDATALSPAQAIPAAWILREATTNILRHSEASAVTVEFAPGTLAVVDDGRGCAAASGVATGDLAGGAGSRAGGAGNRAGGAGNRAGGAGNRAGSAGVASGNGIRGMRERAAAAGAELRVEAAAPSGTKVSVTW